MAALLEDRRIDAAVIVGHSMGSMVAQRVALDYPEQTMGLVLAGSFFSLRDNPASKELWEAVSTIKDWEEPERFASDLVKFFDSVAG